MAVILYNRNHENYLKSVEYKSLSKVGRDLEFYRYTPGVLSSCDLFDVENRSLKPPLNFDFRLTR